MYTNRKNQLFVFAALLCCIFAVSCKREPLPTEQPADPELTVKNELPPFSAGGGSAELRFTTNQDWEIVIEPMKNGAGESRNTKMTTDWYEVSPLMGGPNAEGEEIAVKITVQPNEEYESRGFIIVLKTKPRDAGTKSLEKRMEVTQSKKNAIIIGDSRIEISADDQMITVKVRGNVEYEVSIKDGAGWISEEPSQNSNFATHRNTNIVPAGNPNTPTTGNSGTATQCKSDGERISGAPSTQSAGNMSGASHTFRIAANSNENPRTGVIVFKDRNSDLFDELTVIQAGKNTIKLPSEPVRVTSEEQTITVETESNVEYDITIKEGAVWISRVTEIAALVKKSHSFRISANPAYEPRTGIIVFKDRSSELSVELTVIQVGMEDPNPERAALRAIFNSTGGSGWTKKDNWCDNGKPLSEWYGVETDSEGHVIGLRLRKNNLNGVLSDKIAQLTHLQHIDMSWNALTGEFDKEYKLGGLVELDSLNVNHNDLSGTMCGPKQWGNLKKLEYLNVSSNNINGWIMYPDGAVDPQTRIIELIANDNFLHGMPEALYNHPEYDRLALQMIRQRYGGDGVGGGVRIDQLKKPIHLPNLTFTDLKTGSQRSMNEICASNTMTMLFHWDPTSGESNKFIETFVLKYHTMYRGQGFEAIALLPQDEENPGSDKYKNAARQYLASHDIKWIVAEDYKDDQGRRIVLLDYPNPGYQMYDKTGKLTLDMFKGHSTIGRYRGMLVYGDLSGMEHMCDMNAFFFMETFGHSNYESVDYSMDGNVLTLQEAKTGKGVDIVIVGDAFLDVDIQTGYYETIMRESMEAFFSIHPTKDYRDYFNVYTVCAVSKKSWCNEDRYQTAMGTTRLNPGGIQGSPMDVMPYILKCPIKDRYATSTTIIVNNTGGGKCYINTSGDTYAYSGYWPHSFNDTRHESVGHGFGLLADEYNIAKPLTEETKRHIRDRHNYGIYLNIDLTDDPKHVKWAHLIGHPQFPYVGVVPGGYYTGVGVWRSEENSVMDCNTPGERYFNAWSRELIVRRIMKLAGKQFDFEEFRRNDSDEGRPGKNESTDRHRAESKSHLHHPPVFIDNNEMLNH